MVAELELSLHAHYHYRNAIHSLPALHEITRLDCSAPHLRQVIIVLEWVVTNPRHEHGKPILVYGMLVI